MEWQFIVALIVAIPIILFPAAFIWYLNIGGMYVAIKEALKRQCALQERLKGLAQGEHEAAKTKQ
jgi:hypothetical protein